MGKNTTLKSHSHSVFRLFYHLVLVSKYRRKVLSPKVQADLKNIVKQLCQSWGCELVEFSGELDHIHILFEGHPGIELAKFVNNLKTVTSRLIRRDYATHLARFYTKPVLWSGSYCVLSTGGAPMTEGNPVDEVIKNVTTQE